MKIIVFGNTNRRVEILHTLIVINPAAPEGRPAADQNDSKKLDF
jgi:hypothetical protein